MTTDPIRYALVTSDATSRKLSSALGRGLDVALALTGMVLLTPLLILVALAIAAQGDGPILFRQSRIGRHGREFEICKFRTMVSDSGQVLRDHLATSSAARAEWEESHKLRRDPRVTRLGEFLRKSSLDELPQILNVLRGEMSIVGPRPIVEAEIPRYGQHFTAYCSVKPGITGIWQVSGRNDVSYLRRVEMDALYARKKSVLLDLRIILATIPAVLTRQGSY